MAVAQQGIFAQGTRAHWQLELDVSTTASVDAIRGALNRLREPTVTTGGLNIVIGFGADLLRRLAPDAVPPSFASFVAIDGPGGVAPATQHDIWVWVHGTGYDVVLDAARAVVTGLAPVADLAVEQPGFVYRDSRDLTGFIDGTENPPVAEAHGVAVIPEGETGAGGSFVIAMRWVHDLAAFHALSQPEQEGVIGRSKPDSVELADDVKPPTAHIARVVVTTRMVKSSRSSGAAFRSARSPSSVCTSSRSVLISVASRSCWDGCSARAATAFPTDSWRSRSR
jgi:porphyrinogen peroxidase